MVEKDLIKVFVDEIYSEPPRKNYPNNKNLYNHIDEIWSIDLVDMVDYKSSNKKGCIYIFIINDNFRKDLWCIPNNKKSSKKITEDFSNILTKSKKSPIKTENDRGAKFYHSVFQHFFKNKKNTPSFSIHR